MTDWLDVTRACADIRKFNADSTYRASDWMVGQAFAAYEALPEGQAVCAMMLVDSLWNTSLLRFNPEDFDALFEVYEQHRALYAQTLVRIYPLTLEREPDRVWEHAATMLRPLLESDRTEKRHYSFATKLLHWHAPEHLPIMDSFARKGIHSMQKECGQTECLIRSDVPVGSEVEEYRDWVRFYGWLLSRLTHEERKRLKEEDADSLPKPLHRDNTLLRILDKVFYIRGRPKRGTRTADE